MRINEIKASEWEAFIACVWEQGRIHARNDLPWRFVDDPYAVWVSEVMLQQTQVSRVLSYWAKWMKRFPSIDALSSAAKYDVLDAWQGLGYNKRALNMKEAADICSVHHAGQMPDTLEALQALPGIGPATAAGIMAFAYQKPAIYLETNVRAVYLHHFFDTDEGPVSDKELIPLVERTCSAKKPREWYYALLDYGYHLKKTQGNPSRRAAAYKRQSLFEGSYRQKRAFIVREVIARPNIEQSVLHKLLNANEQAAGRDVVSDESFNELITTLVNEGFFILEEGRLIP